MSEIIAAQLQQCRCKESLANWLLKTLRNTKHISMSCESKLNLRHSPWPAVYLPISTDSRGEIGVALMDGDKCWLFCWERSTFPTVPCSKWLWRKLMRNCGWRGVWQIAFKSLPLVLFQCLSPKKRSIIIILFFFFNNRFQERREVTGRTESWMNGNIEIDVVQGMYYLTLMLLIIMIYCRPCAQLWGWCM